MPINILGQVYTIKTVENSELSEGSYGSVDYKKGEITLNKALNPGMKNIGILHEVIHAIDNSLDLDLTEKQVTGLASVLYSTLSSNGVTFNFPAA